MITPKDLIKKDPTPPTDNVPSPKAPAEVELTDMEKQENKFKEQFKEDDYDEVIDLEW